MIEVWQHEFPSTKVVWTVFVKKGTIVELFRKDTTGKTKNRIYEVGSPFSSLPMFNLMTFIGVVEDDE